MEKFPILNKEDDFVIYYAPLNGVQILDYIHTPYEGYSKESLLGYANRGIKRSEDPRAFDGDLLRINHAQINEGILNLILQRTSYFIHQETQGKVGENRESILPPRDCANTLSVSALTVTIDGGELYLWLGEKSAKVNVIGGGELQLLPAGSASPDDFGDLHATLRETIEESIRYQLKEGLEAVLKRNLIRKVQEGSYTAETYQQVKDDFAIINPGEITAEFTRPPIELASKVALLKPVAYLDRYKARNPWVLYALALAIENQEIINGIKAHKMIAQAGIPGIKGPEFENLQPILLRKPDFEQWYAEKKEKIRPHARGAITVLMNNWDYLLDMYQSCFHLREEALSSIARGQ